MCLSYSDNESVQDIPNLVKTLVTLSPVKHLEVAQRRDSNSFWSCTHCVLFKIRGACHCGIYEFCERRLWVDAELAERATNFLIFGRISRKTVLKHTMATKMDVDSDGSNVMASAGATGSVSVSLHPLVIMNISEHWTRVRAQEKKATQGELIL